MIDPDRLSPKTKQIICDYLKIKTPITPIDTMVVDLNAKLAQVCGFSRMKVKTKQDQTETLVNYYGMIFMPSGWGKDLVPNLIQKELMVDFTTEFRKQADIYFDKRKEELQKEADIKFVSSIAKDSYKKALAPRYIPINVANATAEGFYDCRLELQRAGFGSTFLIIPEFGDYITSSGGHNPQKGDFLSNIIEVYEDGNSDPKIIKSDKDIIAISGVPSNVILHTSMRGLEEGRAREKLMNFFERGAARRFFVAVPMEWHYTEDELRNSYEKGYELSPKIYREMITDMMNGVSAISSWDMDEEAEEFLKEYKIQTMLDAQAMRNELTDGIASSMTSLYRKVIKLSAIIGALEHPSSPIITSDDIEYAIYQADYYLDQLKKFYDLKQLDIYEKLYHHFIANVDKWFTKSDLRLLQIVPADRFAKWINEAISIVQEMAYSNNFKLVAEQYGRSNQGIRYKLVSKIHKK